MRRPSIPQRESSAKVAFDSSTPSGVKSEQGQASPGSASEEEKPKKKGFFNIFKKFSK